MSENIWLIGDARDASSTRRLKTRLEEEWNLHVTGHWPIEKKSFSHPSGDPTYALVIKERCTHNQLDWLKRHYPDVRVVQVSAKWTHLSQSLLALGLSPNAEPNEEEEVPMVTGVQQAAEMLSVSTYAINQAIKRLQVGGGTSSLMPLKRARPGKGGRQSFFWESEQALRAWWTRVGVPEPTLVEELRIVGLKKAGLALGVPTTQVWDMIDSLKRLESENIPSRNEKKHWYWDSEEALTAWWARVLKAKVERETKARQETEAAEALALEVVAPVELVEEPQREMGIEDMDNEIILVVSEDQQKLVAELIQRLDTPEVRFLMGQAPGADTLYQKALTRGLVELGKELG
jgi:hypothetical protein